MMSDEVEKICERLDKIETLQREQHDWQIRRDEADKSKVAIIDDHQNTLYGPAGLKPRVERLEFHQGMKPTWLIILATSVAASVIIGISQWLLTIFKIH